MKNIAKASVGLLIILIVIWSVMTVRGRLQAAKTPAFSEKQIAAVETRTIEDTIEAAGDVAPKTQIDVKPEVGGKVKTLLVEAGQSVKKGELLCEIDDTDLQNQRLTTLTDIAGRKILVERNQANFNRSKELFEAKLVTKESFDNTSNDLAQAKNNLERVERQLQTTEDNIKKARVVAPSDGTVLNVNVVEGQVVVAAASVNSGTTLMTIADLNNLIVNSHINQVDVGRITQKQRVNLTLVSTKEEAMEGMIRFIAPVATTKNSVKGFSVETTIDKPSPQLRPGMTVNLIIPVAAADNAISIPTAALFKGDSEESIVYVLSKKEQTERRGVTIGVSNLDFVEIKSGLKTGERVLMVEPSPSKKKS